MNSVFHIPSSSHLQGYAVMIWEVKGKSDSRELILPQGVIEIVFNFAEQITGLLPDGTPITRAPRCFLQGIHTHLLQSDYIGQHHLLGVRLQPYSVEALLGVQPSELRNTIVDLTLLNPAFDQLWHQLAELQTFPEKVSLLEKELPRFSDHGCSRSKALSDLFLSDRPGAIQSVDNLAQQVCYSSRQLNRVAHRLFGLSAEELTVYKKFTGSVLLMHNTNGPLTEVAYGAGFYDQAHFCRVFKSYTGMTPNYYRKRRSEVPFHIIS